MPATYEPISTQTLGTAVADVYFTSIPQTYTDLVLVVVGTSASNTNTAFRLNSDNTNNYSSTYMYGDGSSAVSGRVTSNSFAYGGNISTTAMPINAFHFFNYTNATTYKTVLIRTAENASTQVFVSLWRKTPEAITSINMMTANGANYSIGTTFTLYGIKAA